MASLRSEFRSLHRRPLLLVALVPGLGTAPSLPGGDQAVAFSASFFAETLWPRQTSMIDARRASTALLNWAVVMHKGGIRTTIFQIGLVSRPWRLASMQTAAAISASAISIPAMNP